MPETLTHEIYYPDGDTVPNVPAAMQAQAESTDQALAAISEAPFIVCSKVATMTLPVSGTMYPVPWEGEVWKQGITHDNTKDADQFIVTEDGLYTANAKVAMYDADHIGVVVINVNGTDRANTQVDLAGSTVSAAYPSGPKPTTITDLKLTAGDVVRVRARSSKNGARLVPAECFFSLRKSAGFAS